MAARMAHSGGGMMMQGGPMDGGPMMHESRAAA